MALNMFMSQQEKNKSELKFKQEVKKNYKMFIEEQHKGLDKNRNKLFKL